MADPALGRHLSAPSVSYGSTNLYMRGALEAETRPNLERVSQHESFITPRAYNGRCAALGMGCAGAGAQL